MVQIQLFFRNVIATIADQHFSFWNFVVPNFIILDNLAVMAGV
jgi:hypothetical protein